MGAEIWDIVCDVPLKAVMIASVVIATTRIGIVSGAVAAAAWGVEEGPERGTMVAARTIGVRVIGVSKSILICIKELFDYEHLSYKRYGGS